MRGAPIDALLVRRDDKKSWVSVAVGLLIVEITPQGAMRFWTFLAAACTAVVAFDQRRNDVQVMHSIASTTDVVQLKNRVLTAPGKANQVNNPRDKGERWGFKNGGRAGAFLGATGGAIGGTLAGGFAGASAGPVGSAVGAAAGVTGGLYTAMAGAAGGRVVDKHLAKKKAKAQANAPPPGGRTKLFGRSSATAPSPYKPPGFFTRLTNKFRGKKSAPAATPQSQPSGKYSGPKKK
ncbi:unnamed protein product [Aphanomyces euteiches]